MQVVRRALLVLAVLFGLVACGPGGVTDTASAVPVITSQPTSLVSTGLSPSVFKVVASGGGLSYQWFRDGTAVAGAIQASLSTTTAGSYYVVVSNAQGKVTSASVTLTITLDPVITVQPKSVAITAGKTAVLSVVATGAGLTYQWYRASTAVAGATNASYQATLAGSYYVVVSSTRSGAKPVTSGTATVTVSATAVAVSITTAPADAVVSVGGAIGFSVVASGTDLAYQWYKNGLAIGNANSSSYALDPVASVDAGSYYVVVSNSLGLVASSIARLTVTASGSSDNTAVVVSLANAFLDTLAGSQKITAASALDSSTVQFANAQANAIAWSGSLGNRHGLRLNSAALNAGQLSAANALIAAALSTSGATQVSEIRLTDDVVNAIMPTLGAGANLYSIAFIGQPSLTQPWTLQVTGHNLGHNISFNATYPSATPMFLGAQPPNWVFASGGSYVLGNSAVGTQHAPMEVQRLAVSALATGLQGDTKTAALSRLLLGPTDLVMGPTVLGDTRFKTLAYPAGTVGRGALFSALATDKQAAVKAVIEAWVKTQASDLADNLLATYETDAALAATYVGYYPGSSGSADFGAYPNGSALPLSSANSYLRIDGPRVWIEVLVKADSTQTGVLANTVSYQSVWRDKLADYGGRF